MTDPVLWQEQISKIWDLKFSQIVDGVCDENDYDKKESVVNNMGFDVERVPSICKPINNIFGVGCTDGRSTLS